MEKENMSEYIRIENELEKLLKKYDELNAQTDKIKSNLDNMDTEELDVLISKLELHYAIIDKKMSELKKQSEILKNKMLKK